MAWHDIAASEDVEAGTPHIVAISGREIGVLRVGSELFAVLNRCGHAGAPIAYGRVEPTITSPGPGQPATLDKDNPELRCPWHHWGFNLRTGACTAPVRRPRLKTFPVKEEAGRIWLEV